MKSSVFSLKSGNMTWFEAIDYAKRLGVSAIEPYPCAELAVPDVSAARAVRRYADERGLAVSCFSTGACLTGRKAASEIERLKRYADVCAALGSPYLHHTLIPGLNPAQTIADFDAEIAEAARNAREVYDYAEKRGVACVYEDQGFCINGVVNFERFLRELERPAGIVADLGNILFVGETPEAFVGRFAGRIVHVHVKDYLFKDGGGDDPGEGWYRTRSGDFLRGTVIGHGVIAFGKVFRRLAESGYDGCFSMEFDGLEDMETAHRLGLANMSAFWQTACARSGRVKDT